MSGALGATERRTSNLIWVNLRLGDIAQTSKEPKPGFEPAETRNKSGEVHKFYAKRYDSITAYIKDIRWRTSEVNGATLNGWEIFLDTTKEVYVLYVGSKDHPFQRMMNTLLNVDFTRPVKISGFMGGGQDGRPKRKVLTISQGGERVMPKYTERWLSRIIADKIKKGVELTEQEANSVALTPDGQIDRNVPHIKQNSDGTWSFDDWNDFLFEQIQDEVIPKAQAAAQERGDDAVVQSDEEVSIGSESSLPSFPPSNAMDDGIPF